mmetsp:Transcript_9187/g.19387  ORF Transcript_9187/g.19387 Transcript_9187/m.19387 type:complete len:451 (-) Transcript_9187:327-1679(-)
MTLEQPAHVVYVPVEHDPILVGTLVDVVERVHRPLPAQEDGDEAEDAHEEAGRDEDHEADGHLLAPRLLGLRVLLSDALVRHREGDAAAEVVPPHGAFVVVRLLDGDGTGLLGTPVGRPSVATIVAPTVTRLVVAGAGIVIELVPHGGGKGSASDGATVARRTATVVAVLIGDALVLFSPLGSAAAGVETGLIRPTRLLALGVVTLLGVVTVGGAATAFRSTARLDAGWASRDASHLVVPRGRRIIRLLRIVIVDPRSVMTSVGIVGAELVGHAIGIVTAATPSSSSTSLRTTRFRTSRTDRPRIRIDAVTTAIVVAVTTPPGGTAAATHSVVLIVVVVVAGDVVDHLHEASRVAGAIVVVVGVIAAMTSGGALGQRRCDALGGTTVDGSDGGLLDGAITLGDADVTIVVILLVGRRWTAVLGLGAGVASAASAAAGAGGLFGTDGVGRG